MGGKNPVIVTRRRYRRGHRRGDALRLRLRGPEVSAGLAGLRGAPRGDEFIDGLIAKAEKVAVGDPLDRSVYLGPVIDRRAVERFSEAVTEARSAGSILAGGEVITDGDSDGGTSFSRPWSPPRSRRGSGSGSYSSPS